MKITDIQKIDTEKMYEIYDNWPYLARKNYEFEHKKIEFRKIKHIVFVGMGGSGALGEIFDSILSKSKIHVSLVKGYHLPMTTNSETLVIVTSVSGNTIEALSVLKLALKTKAKVLVFSSGGKMKKICIKNKVDYREIPMVHSPRASFPTFLFSMLKILEPILPITKSSILESITELEKTQQKIKSDNLTKNNPALSLAKEITGIPLIYYPWGLQASAIRFKNSLQENAKCHVISEDVVEACHNGVVSWEKKSKVQPILIQGKDDFIKTKEQIKVLKKFFKKKSIEWNEVTSVKGGILSKLINLIYLLDYASIYLAILKKTDPTPVNAIDFIKSEINKIS